MGYADANPSYGGARFSGVLSVNQLDNTDLKSRQQASSIERVSQIAAVVNLFKSQFPEIAVDLSRWVKSAETAKYDDPHSIDLAFHFPRRNFACQSQTILMQIRLPEAFESNPQQAMGIELSGHDYMGQQWRFATTGG